MTQSDYEQQTQATRAALDFLRGHDPGKPAPTLSAASSAARKLFEDQRQLVEEQMRAAEQQTQATRAALDFLRGHDPGKPAPTLSAASSAARKLFEDQRQLVEEQMRAAEQQTQATRAALDFLRGHDPGKPAPTLSAASSAARKLFEDQRQLVEEQMRAAEQQTQATRAALDFLRGHDPGKPAPTLSAASSAARKLFEDQRQLVEEQMRAAEQQTQATRAALDFLRGHDPGKPAPTLSAASSAARKLFEDQRQLVEEQMRAAEQQTQATRAALDFLRGHDPGKPAPTLSAASSAARKLFEDQRQLVEEQMRAAEQQTQATRAALDFLRGHDSLDDSSSAFAATDANDVLGSGYAPALVGTLVELAQDTKVQAAQETTAAYVADLFDSIVFVLELLGTVAAAYPVFGGILVLMSLLQLINCLK